MKTPLDINEDENYNPENLDTETWVDYPGYYVKEFYDLYTSEGTFRKCWPNAGIFYSHKENKRILPENIIQCKFSVMDY